MLGGLTEAAGSNAAPTILQSALLGVALGFLWAPCAGPILDIILTGAAINGPSTQATALLFSYALGATVSLALAVLVGGRVFAAMRRSLGAGEWIRRGLGVAQWGSRCLIPWTSTTSYPLPGADAGALPRRAARGDLGAARGAAGRAQPHGRRGLTRIRRASLSRG